MDRAVRFEQAPVGCVRASARIYCRMLEVGFPEHMQQSKIIAMQNGDFYFDGCDQNGVVLGQAGMVAFSGSRSSEFSVVTMTVCGLRFEHPLVA